MQATPQWVMHSPDPARLHSREGKLLGLRIHVFKHLSKVAKTEGYCNLLLQKDVVFVLPLNC